MGNINLNFTEDGKPLCKHCLENNIERKMAKAGWGLSGTKKYRRYKCTLCGYVVINYNEPAELPEVPEIPAKSN